ncbi:MAG: Holliday junction resolvase RuvX [candidate division Zixibacteria bacterium]
MESNRFLGLDYGSRRIGVAISDPQGLIAQPLDTLIVSGMKNAVEQVKNLIDENEINDIVIGLPLNLSGQPSDLSRETELFATELKKEIKQPVYFEDERLSSKQAEQVLHSHGKKIKGNKGKIDRISAAIILQSYLDRRNI